MGQYTIVLTEEEEKALFTNMTSIFEWLNTAIHHKAQKCMDKIVLEHSDKQPDKIPTAEKLQIVRDAVVESALERNARIEAELKGI